MLGICDGSVNADLEMKQKPMDSNQMKPEKFPPGLNMLKSEDQHNLSQDVLTDAQVRRATESGKLCVLELGI